jgi:hypothetical protein
LTAIQKFIKKENPERVTFNASKQVGAGQNSQSRARLYDRMVQRYASAWGYQVHRKDAGEVVTYDLVRKDTVNEISRDRLERYLDRAGRQVDTRQERMARARQRLSRSYEIYHADEPTKIVDRFEADTPADAQRYYQDYIANYDSDVDYDLRLRRGTGIMESENNSTPEVYLDMDGVLANFMAGYNRVAGTNYGPGQRLPHPSEDPTLKKITGTDFFSTLPKFASADALVRMVVDQYGHYNICSSPLRGDHENSDGQLATTAPGNCYHLKKRKVCCSTQRHS